MINYVQEIYKPFKAMNEISKKISELLTPEETKTEVEIIYQSIEDLHILLSKSPRRLVFYWKLSNTWRK